MKTDRRPPEPMAGNPAISRRILPPLWFLLMLCLMLGLHTWLPMGQYIRAPWNFLGLALLLFGAFLGVVSARSFLREGTGLVPFDEAKVLVTHGFFQYSRNPMYLGMALMLLGTSGFLGSFSSLLPVPLFMVIIHRRFILAEEKFLEDAFGEAYLSYQASVRRWL